MADWERVTKAFNKLAEACSETLNALSDWVSSAVKTLCDGVDFTPIIKATAYTLAQKEHPEWVHKATHSKKKRIRKKYHDRIMREYGRIVHD